MEIACAECGCLVERGQITQPCPRFPACCCADLSQTPVDDGGDDA